MTPTQPGFVRIVRMADAFRSSRGIRNRGAARSLHVGANRGLRYDWTVHAARQADRPRQVDGAFSGLMRRTGNAY